jgi:hypothetical protein
VDVRLAELAAVRASPGSGAGEELGRSCSPPHPVSGPGDDGGRDRRHRVGAAAHRDRASLRRGRRHRQLHRPFDFGEVIQTAPGHDIRLVELPSTTIGSNGVLYAAWNDRPDGLGGPPSNSTRIYLSFSRNGDRTWSKPQVISGPVSNRVVTDRFQPWITADASGLHAMWYQRAGTQIQTDAENLSLATASAGPRPGPEVRVSTVRFPVIRTNPNQDPVISTCYMGDYNNIASANETQYISWGDNRNVVKTTLGVEHQPDVFLAIRR